MIPYRPNEKLTNQNGILEIITDSHIPPDEIWAVVNNRIQGKIINIGNSVNNTIDFDNEVKQILDNIHSLLINKNTAYGNSALDPIRIFSSAPPIEQIKIRIDDKLSRISRGKNLETIPEDTINDLIGYLVLLKIANKKQD